MSHFPLNPGDTFLLHSNQVSGCYLDPLGRMPHFAVPGRYTLLERQIHLVKITSGGQHFECCVAELRGILGPWSEYKEAE